MGPQTATARALPGGEDAAGGGGEPGPHQAGAAGQGGALAILGKGADEVEVVNDSELVAKQVNGVYKVKHPDMRPLHAEALKAPNVRFVNSGLSFVKEERNYANTDGSVITQTLVRSWPFVQITAVSDDFSDVCKAANALTEPVACPSNVSTSFTA